jgi:hypothetical protein
MHDRGKSGFIAAVLLTAAICIGGYITRQTWLRFIAESLVCQASEAPSDAILVDLVEHNYLLFERAHQLQASGLASVVLVPILTLGSEAAASSVAMGFVDVMCRVASVSDCTTFPASATEPFSLNLARRAAEELRAHGVRSVLMVTAGFRSRRAATVYTEILRPLGITVHCQPVFGQRTLDNWFDSTHGIEEVTLQIAKLLYYRLGVMPSVQ